jgi:hypothetical protein
MTNTPRAPTPRAPKVRFQVTLEGERSNDNAHVHTLKFILKHLLRARSLRCVDAKEVVVDDEQEPQS